MYMFLGAFDYVVRPGQNKPKAGRQSEQSHV